MLLNILWSFSPNLDFAKTLSFFCQADWMKWVEVQNNMDVISAISVFDQFVT